MQLCQLRLQVGLFVVQLLHAFNVHAVIVILRQAHDSLIHTLFYLLLLLLLLLKAFPWVERLVQKHVFWEGLCTKHEREPTTKHTFVLPFN